MDERQAFVRLSAPEDAPDVAVGQNPVCAGAAGVVGAQVSANLVLGLSADRDASAGQVVPKRLGFQNNGGRSAARERGGGVVKNNIRAVVAGLQLAPLMRDRIAKKRQRRVDEMRDGVFLAVISEPDEVSAVGEQCSGGIGGVGHWDGARFRVFRWRRFARRLTFVKRIINDPRRTCNRKSRRDFAKWRFSGEKRE